MASKGILAGSTQGDLFVLAVGSAFFFTYLAYKGRQKKKEVCFSAEPITGFPRLAAWWDQEGAIRPDILDRLGDEMIVEIAEDPEASDYSIVTRAINVLIPDCHLGAVALPVEKREPLLVLAQSLGAVPSEVGPG